jgi:protein TonB
MPEPPVPDPPAAAPASAPTPRSQPAAVSAPPAVNGKNRSFGMAAAVIVIVAAIGFPLGTYWLGRQEVITVADVAQRTAPAQAPAAIDRPVPTAAVAPAAAPAPARAVEETATPVKVNTSAPAPRQALPPGKPLTGKPTPPRNTRPNTASRLPAPVAAPVQAPAPPEVTPPAPEPVQPEPAPAPEAPAAAAGPFFEPRQVDQAPGIASRVEPHVPDNLGPLNDVVVVRVLVSQTGHPSIVSLLRRSKAGSALDEAVVAAVKQWTFSPARKRGEAVSCWFNVGVPINRAQ